MRTSDGKTWYRIAIPDPNPKQVRVLAHEKFHDDTEALAWKEDGWAGRDDVRLQVLTWGSGKWMVV